MSDLLEPADPGRGSRTLTDPAGRADPTAAAAVPPAPAGGIASPAAPAPADVSPDKISGALPGAPILLFDRVSKWYGPVIGVNQVTLELRPGITALVGGNGSGKSTLLRLAAGQVRPDLGAVRVGGHDAWGAAAKRHVGYCPENDTFYEEMSGRRFVEAMARLHGYPRREAVRRTADTLELVGMQGRAGRTLRGYSRGMRQRIKLAQALLHDPPLLLLDEPLSGIDPVGRRESVELFLGLARRGKCLLVSSHELDELEKLTDHVAIMARGRIAAVGGLTQIRDLLDAQPLSVRIDCPQSRKLAQLLLDMEEVVSVERQDGDRLLVRARRPRHFFQQLAALVLEEHLEVSRLETLDDSTQAILGYLLGGRR